MQITQARSAKTLTPSHMKQCILSESRFDFLKDLVKNIPDPSAQEDNENNANEVLDYSSGKPSEEPTKHSQENNKQKPEIMANFYTEQQQSTSAGRMPVIQYGPKVTQTEQPKLSFSIENIVNKETEPKLILDLSQGPVTSAPSSSQIPIPHLVSNVNNKSPVVQNVPASTSQTPPLHDNIPPLIPISHNNLYGPSSGDNNLYIDEDYDN
ncbi:hypothetical protein ILUMI_08755 [Ignelater luminosus]|uniref:Dr1-associated corepressor n=1 Tax=Ignelater luminosus TaxID=2038154 RepID=A0A8K0D1B6_IGNLU|nr:hypothetical protein ILUMI_08755 [Ignelater luminosus]